MTGRVVLVTGGTKGIGRAVATRFADAGATVCVCARREPEPPVAHTFFPCDVRDPGSVDAMVSGIVDRFGRLDVVVNSAGGSPPASAATASPRFHAAVVTLNLIAALHVSQRANAQMQTQDEGGCMISITSLSGMRPSPGTAAYGAAKAGLINLAQSLAVEWAPKVRVNTVAASLVETELTRASFGPEALAALTADVPMGRLCRPEDVADACLYLASPLAAFVTGTNLVVHGGGEVTPRATGWPVAASDVDDDQGC